MSENNIQKEVISVLMRMRNKILDDKIQKVIDYYRMSFEEALKRIEIAFNNDLPDLADIYVDNKKQFTVALPSVESIFEKDETMSEKIDLQKLYDEGKLKPGDEWITKNNERLIFVGKNPFTVYNPWVFAGTSWNKASIGVFYNDGSFSDTSDEGKGSNIIGPASRKIKYDFWVNMYKDDEVQAWSTKEECNRYQSGCKRNGCLHFTGEFNEGEGLENK